MAGMIDQRPALLATLRGCPLSVLMCLMLYPDRGLGTMEICQLTRWSAGPVTAGLRLLARQGLAQNHGLYNAWMLTLQARQLVLDEQPRQNGNAILALESHSSTRECYSSIPECYSSTPDVVVSSSSYDPDLDPEELPTTNQPPPPRESHSSTPDAETAIPAAAQNLVGYLVNECGAAPSRARCTVRAAMALGADVDDLRGWAETYLSYCATPNGRSINNPGAFICSRLACKTPPPAWYKPREEQPGNRRFIEGEYADCINH
jgi:hypothetical protein